MSIGWGITVLIYIYQSCFVYFYNIFGPPPLNTPYKKLLDCWGQTPVFVEEKDFSQRIFSRLMHL